MGKYQEILDAIVCDDDQQLAAYRSIGSLMDIWEMKESMRKIFNHLKKTAVPMELSLELDRVHALLIRIEGE